MRLEGKKLFDGNREEKFPGREACGGGNKKDAHKTAFSFPIMKIDFSPRLLR